MEDEAELKRELRWELQDVAPAGEATEQAIEQIISAFQRQMPGSSAQQLWNIIKSDMAFPVSAIMCADRCAAHTDRVWLYRFDGYGSEMAYHAWDIAPVFGNPLTAVMTAEKQARFDQLHADMSGAWLAFARGESPGWDAFEGVGGAEMRFDCPESRAVMTDGEEGVATLLGLFERWYGAAAGVARL